MRLLARNMKPLWYCLYQESVPQEDDGYETSEKMITYGEPVKMEANISPATGAIAETYFGQSERYDKLILTCDMDCPIDENSVLFIDKEPQQSDYLGHPQYDYVVVSVSKFLNHIAIGVRKVRVS